MSWNFLMFGEVSDISGRSLTLWEGCWQFRKILDVSGRFSTFQGDSWRFVVFADLWGGFWRFGVGCWRFWSGCWRFMEGTDVWGIYDVSRRSLTFLGRLLTFQGVSWLFRAIPDVSVRFLTFLGRLLTFQGDSRRFREVVVLCLNQHPQKLLTHQDPTQQHRIFSSQGSVVQTASFYLRVYRSYGPVWHPAWFKSIFSKTVSRTDILKWLW